MGGGHLCRERMPGLPASCIFKYLDVNLRSEGCPFTVGLLLNEVSSLCCISSTVYVSEHWLPFHSGSRLSVALDHYTQSDWCSPNTLL